MVYDLGGSKLTKNVPVIESDRGKFAISDDEILTLARWAVIIEDHYSAVLGVYTPMDIGQRMVKPDSYSSFRRVPKQSSRRNAPSAR